MFKNLLYFFQGIFTFFFYPLTAVFIFLLFLLWDANYYVRILSRMQIVPSYIQSIQENRDYTLKKELSEDPSIVAAKEKQVAIENSILLMQEYLEKLSRQNELEQLELQHRQWQSSKEFEENFDNETDFQKERRQQLAHLKRQIKDIKNLQKNNRVEINLVKKNISKEQRSYRKQQQTIALQEKRIVQKYTKQENNLSGKVFRDLSKLSSILNDAFDIYLLQQTVQDNISNYLYFFTHYQEAVAQKFIYTNMSPDNILDSRIIRFPAIAIHFMAEVQEDGENKKSHVFREILLREVKNRNDLESGFLLETILQNLDSALVSRIISKRLQKFNFSFSGDVLKNHKPLELTGENAIQVERFIFIFSYLYSFRYALIVLPILLLLALFFASVSRPYKRFIVLMTLIVPSFFFIVLSIAGMFFSKQILFLLPNLAQNIVALNLSSSLVNSFFHETFFWILIFFAIHFFLGLVFRYSKIWKKKANSKTKG